MSEIQLTPAQASAVRLRSCSLLVSAAAGSGKTRVLTLRLMAYVCDDAEPQDINRFLIITYTRAAAAELRGRILDELALRCAQAPDNRRLRRQSSLCYHAPIGTIHSFCTTILREHCHKLSLSPDFRVGDEDKCAELREKALEKLLDKAYENITELSGMAALVNSVGAGRSDARLEDAILNLHQKMRSHPYPELWAEQQLAQTDVSACRDATDTVWGRELLENAKSCAKYWSQRLDKLWFELCEYADENAPIISAYGNSILETMEALRNLIRALDIGWDEARLSLPIPFPRLAPLKNYPFDDRKNNFTATRDDCKKAMLSLGAIFDEPSEMLLAELSQTAPSIRALISLALEFDKLYSTEKRRQNLLDFSDLEHFAVELLCNAQTGLPTETALELSNRYTEIMVDEYQDVNAVQELIFRCISKNEKNIFMVGDVKQSIYRFRLADPSIFIGKYHRFSELQHTSYGENSKILLQNNFRSDRQILTACNHVFRNIMSEALGEIDYNADAALIPPENAPEPHGLVKMSIIATPSAEDGEETVSKTALEADFVADQIFNLVQSGETILDKGVYRKIAYDDIAILLRSPGPAGGAYRHALHRRGIPVLSEQGSGFFIAPEIVVMRAFLSIIDNPHRDIPLTAVLSSEIFGFTADELSLIRSNNRDCDFFTAVCSYGLKHEKTADFLETLQELRELSAHIGVRALLSLIYDRQGLPALCAASGSGNGSATNLMLLLELADKFEAGGYRGLFGFLKQLNRMEERGDEPRTVSSSAVAGVSIMSIHKSKGLEFPVVFLGNTSRKFNIMDLRSPVLVHPVLGIGGKLCDLERGIEYPCLSRRAIASRLTKEMLSEEMRVLYVAMTRARQRLYVSCTTRDPDALIAKLSMLPNGPIDPEILRCAPSISHWLISAALLGDGGQIELKTISADRSNEPLAASASADISPTVEVAPTALCDLAASLSFVYPYESASALPSKLTATVLPREEHDDDAQSLVAGRSRLFRMPELDGNKRPLSAAERGTATHIVMQFIDFAASRTLADIETEITRIVALRQLNERQAKAVDRAAILNFFHSETGELIKHADKVYREFRFSLLCPAEEFFKDGGQEQLLLQGVVDCCIEHDGKLTIIDYKTDYVTAESLEEHAAFYKNQLRAYAYAMERIIKKPVSACLLCFLRSGFVAKL